MSDGTSAGRRRQALTWALVVLLIGLAASAFLAWRQAQSNAELIRERFNAQAERLVDRTIDTVESYEQGLQAARGVVMTGGEDGITREAFREYSETRDYATEFPGAFGFGFVRVVPPGEVDEFVKAAKADGAPADFAIVGEEHPGDKWVVEYIEPEEPNKAALGIDAAAEESRKAVGTTAMRTGRATISPPITLTQAQDAEMAGFLIELPVYRPDVPTETADQREKATFGWTYAVLVADDVIGQVEGPTANVAMGVYDSEAGSPEDLFYEDPEFPAAAATDLQYDASRNLYNRDWDFVVRAEPSFVSAQSLMSPVTVFVVAAMSSVLLAGVVFLALSAAARSREVVEQQEVRALLERKVDERTREVAAERDRAEQAAQAKSQFLAHMSHEIRTPMNAVIGMSDLALGEPMSPRAHTFVDKANRSAKNLMGILNDILDFSKIEAGQLQLEQTPFRLDEVLEDFATLVGLRAEEKGIEVNFDVTPDVPYELVGDRLRLGQILLNLGNNAVKFTEAGSVTLGVRVDRIADSRVLLVFRVTDTGIGISDDQRARLFSPFSQGDTSVSRRYGGSGLGLVISKSLVEAMNGDIWVDSETGQGSTFAFTAEFGLGGSTGRRRMPTAAELSGRRLLVVDDSEVSRIVLTEMARRLTLVADSAASISEAEVMLRAAIAAGEPYDLVLMDWRMPNEDGLAGLARLAAEFGDIPPVIMVSAFSAEELRQAATEQGVTLSNILTKPVLPSRFMEAVGVALGYAEAMQPPSGDRANVTTAAIPALDGKRALLVEDNEFNQELALEVLRGSAEMDVVVAGDGQEALDILAEDGRFDVVLMDCMMPVLDGYEATRRIRANPEWADLPVIAMTANTMEGDRERVIAAGMNDHVAKPIDVSVLLSTIARWIGSSATGPQGGGAHGA